MSIEDFLSENPEDRQEVDYFTHIINRYKITPSFMKQHYKTLNEIIQNCDTETVECLYADIFANPNVIDCETVDAQLDYFREKYPLDGDETFRYNGFDDTVGCRSSDQFPIDWCGLSRNPNFNFEYIRKNQDLPWYPGCLNFNPHIKVDQYKEFISKYDDFFDNDEPFEYHVALVPSITEKYISENLDKINWKLLSSNTLNNNLIRGVDYY